MSSSKAIARLPLHLVLCVVAAIFVYPMVWTVLTAFRSPAEFALSPWALPTGLYLSNFVEAWNLIGIGRLLLNSLVVSLGATTLACLFGLMAAYAIVRSRSRAIMAVQLLFLAAMFVPFDVMMVSLFVSLRQMGMLNTYPGLIGPYVALNLPLIILILTNAVREVPGEIIESAKIDGANSWQILFGMIAPIIWPSIAAAAVLSFVGNWNEFVIALVAMPSPTMQTLPVGIAGFINPTMPRYELTFAGIVISMVPMLVVFVTLQRFFLAGVTAGAVK